MGEKENWQAKIQREEDERYEKMLIEKLEHYRNKFEKAKLGSYVKMDILKNYLDVVKKLGYTLSDQYSKEEEEMIMNEIDKCNEKMREEHNHEDSSWNEEMKEEKYKDLKETGDTEEIDKYVEEESKIEEEIPEKGKQGRNSRDEDAEEDEER